MQKNNVMSLLPNWFMYDSVKRREYFDLANVAKYIFKYLIFTVKKE